MTRERALSLVTGLSLFVLALLLAVSSAALGQGNASMSIDLEKLAPNLEPEFTIWRTGQGGPAAWAAVADPTAAGGRAIAQTSTDKTDYRFPLAIYRPFSGKNLDVAVRFKPVAGSIDQAGGIALRLLTSDDYYVVRANALEDNVRFYRVVKGKREQLAGSVDQAGGIAVRLQTPDDYYVVRANALEDNVRFYRVIKGKREQLAGTNTKVAANIWHTLGLKAEGDRFTVSYDGSELFTARDATFAEPGKVALWTKADSVTHFDSLTIRSLPEGGKQP